VLVQQVRLLLVEVVEIQFLTPLLLRAVAVEALILLGQELEQMVALVAVERVTLVPLAVLVHLVKVITEVVVFLLLHH